MGWVASVPSPKSLGLRCVQNLSSARCEEGASRTIFILAGSKPNCRIIKMVRDVTDEQRSSRPIFNAIPRAAAGWPFFLSGRRRTRSDGMTQIAALRYRQSGSCLEQRPTDPATAGRNPKDLRDGALGYLPQGGFTITELIVVVTLIILLAALAVTAYNKLVNDARVAKSANLVTTLATAKSMFVADKNTTPAEIAAFNAAPESNFATIAPYIRINGATPKDMNDLLSLCGIPSNSGITVTIGTVDDGSSGGGTTGTTPTVTGYGYSASSPTPGG
jgi:type II secretory pathway pseudopilin PulG